MLPVCLQGFVEAKMLAKKFASLYYLLEDLLSPQKHYDWGLRAIKSVLVVAGSLLRAEEGQLESNVLFRALRDLNIAKILSQVTPRLLDQGVDQLFGMSPRLLSPHPLRVLSHCRCPVAMVCCHRPQDMVVFMGLLNDLFPGISPPRTLSEPPQAWFVCPAGDVPVPFVHARVQAAMYDSSSNLFLSWFNVQASGTCSLRRSSQT